MRRRGFTLLELLVVLAIMGLIMGTSIASYFSMGQGARMRGAVSTIQSSLALARQRAILHQKPISVVFLTITKRFDLPESAYAFQDEATGQRYGEVMHVPSGIDLDLSKLSDDRITFRPSGAADEVTSTIELSQAGSTVNWQITVYGLTGLTMVDEVGP